MDAAHRTAEPKRSFPATKRVENKRCTFRPRQQAARATELLSSRVENTLTRAHHEEVPQLQQVKGPHGLPSTAE